MEVVKFSLAQTLITEEERRILAQAIQICERVLVNAIPVIEVLPDPVSPESCLGDRGKLRLNGRTEQ